MRIGVLCLALLIGSIQQPAFGQQGASTPSAQEIRRELTRGIVVPPAGQPPGPQGTNPDPGVTAQRRPSIDLTVTFATGSAAITPAGERVLAELGEALASPDLAQYRFRLEGHTDTVGDTRTNQSLSERRAAAVATWLIRRYRIQPERLEAIGMGESTPLVATPDSTPEPRNRRVRVVNLGG